MLSSTQYFQRLSRLVADTQITAARDELGLDAFADRMLEKLREVREREAKVMLVGNGGSAAIVSHLHNDLCKACGIRALVFHETPLLTALANDESYTAAFARGVELWAEPADMLIAVSSSGRSPNILAAVAAAVERGCHVVTFSGFAADNPLRTLGDVNAYVASSEYGPVELAHQMLIHWLSDCCMLALAVGADTPAAANT